MYYTSILVSVTETCTVGCRHCGFTGAVRLREAKRDDVASWVGQACDAGIPFVIFTGGEPFQRFKLLEAGVRTANDRPRKPRIGIFTSSFWARDAAAVDKILDRLPGVDFLYLSTDVFHQEQVPAQYVINVIEGARRHGIPNVSLCITIGADEELEQVLPLYEQYQGEVLIHVDRVITSPYIDTAASEGLAPVPDNFTHECYLGTPIINPNGDLATCHVAKYGAHKPLRDEVYFLGNLHTESFAEIMARAAADPRYTFLRAFGPKGVARMVQQSDDLRGHLGDRTFSNACDMCSKVLFTRRGKAALDAWVADPLNRALADLALERRLGAEAELPHVDGVAPPARPAAPASSAEPVPHPEPVPVAAPRRRDGMPA